MSNVYRISGEEMCDLCVEKTRRIHELEAHDQDEGELRVYAVAAMHKLFWLGLALCVIGGGSALLGDFVIKSLEGSSGKILGCTIWLFGVYVFINAIIVSAKYHSDKATLKHHLEAIRDMRRSEILKLKKKLREAEKKEKESHG